MAVTDTISAGKKLTASLRSGAVATRDERAVAYVEILDLREALAQIGDDWRALECQLDQATVFQSVAWASSVQGWLETQAEGRDEAIGVHDHEVVITRNKDGVLTGVWPVQVERHFGLQFAVALGEPFNQYSDILIAPDIERSVVIDAMVIALQSLGRFAGVIMRKVREDARCVSRISELGRKLSNAAAPAVDLRPYDGFAAYHKTVKTKTRKNLRNARNRLERDAQQVVHVVHEDRDAISAVAARAYELRAKRLARDGLSSRAFMDSGFERFIETLCGTTHPAHALQLVAFELRLGDEMLSLQWGFVDRGRYYAFMAVRNPDYDSQSPGRLHLEDVIRSCADMGVEVVDFLAPDVDYKRTWSTEVVPVRDYGIAFTAGGRFVLSGLMGAPRRFARAGFDRLPDGVRAVIIRLAGRLSD